MKSKRLLSLMLSFVMLGSLIGCGTNNTVSTEIVEEPAIVEVSTDYKDASLSVDERINSLINQMTVEEKVGQLIQAEQAYITPEEVRDYYIGSVLSGGGSAPSTGNSVEDWNNRISDFKRASFETRLGIPIIYGIDAVHGNNNISGATVFPHNIGLGAANDVELMKEIGKVVANETMASAADWTFAPCIGNPQDISWGRTYEGFSENAADIGPLAAAYVESIEKNGTVACAKHFIGEGYTENGVNQGDVKMTPEEFDALLESGILDPYRMCVNAGVHTVMASYNSVNGMKCHENHHLLTEVLKKNLGFNGLVVGDYNAVSQVSGNSFKDQLKNCVNAGVDLLMEPDNWKMAYENVLALAKEGEITEERLDDAVARNLRVKFEMGLFDKEVQGQAEKEAIESFGSEAHREVARDAVRKSLVLLKNDEINGTTAINALKVAKVLSIEGQKAFDLGSQCGGWTISWQGMTGNKNVVGTPIIQGIYNEVSDYATVNHSVDGEISEGTDAIIAVFGETPYAETDGDRKESFPKMSSDDEKMLKSLKKNLSSVKENVPVVAIIIAGRPIDITEYEDMFDGIVMAWLPGSEGQGISDVLFGDYDFTGTTKYTWPGLYEYGYGMTKNGEIIR